MSQATLERFAAICRENVETGISCANTAFSGAERLCALNMNAVRGILEDVAANVTTMLAAKDPRDVVALQVSLAQPALEKVVAYSRSVFQVVSHTNDEIGKFVESRVADFQKDVASVLTNAAKNAPVGNDVALSVVKSAIAAATTAYDSLAKAAKEVAELTANNVTAATDATLKASAAAAPKLKQVA